MLQNQFADFPTYFQQEMPRLNAVGLHFPITTYFLTTFPSLLPYGIYITELCLIS